MTPRDHPRSLLPCCLGVLLLAGCNVLRPTPAVTTSTATNPPSSGTPSPLSVPTARQVYAVVPGFPTDANWSPDSVFIFPTSISGPVDDEIAHIEIAGSQIGVDESGNVYTLTTKGIQVTPPSAPGLAYKVDGLGTQLESIRRMAVSPDGHVFVSDGKGVAVFPSGTYILGQSQSVAITPGHITADASNNVYVENTTDSSIVVFGPTASGTVAPERIIAGPTARLTTGDDIRGMATDSSGNLYVLCNCVRSDGSGADVGIFEYSATASGNVVPIRFVTAPGMVLNGSDGALALDSAGTIYADVLSADNQPVILEFSADASGSVAPSNTVTLPALTGSPLGIAVH